MGKMAEVSPGSPSPEEAPGRTGQTNGETRKAEQKADGEKRAGSQAQRREKTEASVRKTAADAKKATKAFEEAVVAKKAQGPPEKPPLLQTHEVIFETEIPVGAEGIEFKASVYKREDGSFVMSRLPTNKYDRQTITRIVRGSGIKQDFETPKNWDGLSTEEKVDYLRGLGIDTLTSPLNIMPGYWGHQAQNPLENESFRELILHKWDNLGQPLPDIEAEIVRRVHSADSKWIESAARDFGEIRASIAGNPQLIAELDLVLPPAMQQEIADARESMEGTYEVLMDGFDERARISQIGDIDRVARSELTALRQGWHSSDVAIQDLLRVAGSRRDVRGAEGLRMWYAFRQIEMLLGAQDIFEKTQVQPDPIANIQAAEEVMRFFERRRTPETFGLARERLVQLQQAVELSTDPRVTAQIKETFKKRIESFEAVNTLIITMNTTEGDPEQLLNVARRFFTNETFYYFYDRFNPEELRDSDGNRYLVGVNGNPIDLNILGEDQNANVYQLLVDRFRDNKVQEMMRRQLNPQTLDEDERWIIRRILNLPANFNLANLTPAQINNLGNLWREEEYLGPKWVAVTDWSKETTLLGVDGYDSTTGRPMLRLELWQNIVTQRHLRRRLLAGGVDPDRVNAMLGTLQNPNQDYDPVNNPVTGGDYELIQALKRNGYDLAKFVFQETIDRFEFLTQDGEHTSTIFGEETPYLAHVVSHFMDFALSEFQGDPRVNEAVFRQFREQWDRFGGPHSSVEGFLLPQNLTAFRLLSQMGDTPTAGVILPQNLRNHLEARISAEMGAMGVPRREVDGYIYAQELFRGIDPDNPTLTDEFANIDWANNSRFMKSYDLSDMLEDRTNTYKWFMGKFREWLLHPTDKEFFEMMQEYYSRRNPRRHPGTADLLEIEWEVGKHWRQWFGYKENISNATMEGFVQQAEELSLVDRGRGENLKRRLLGHEPVRSARQLAAFGRRSLRETVFSPGWWAGGIFDFFKTLFSYLTSGK